MIRARFLVVVGALLGAGGLAFALFGGTTDDPPPREEDSVAAQPQPQEARAPLRAPPATDESIAGAAADAPGEDDSTSCDTCGARGDGGPPKKDACPEPNPPAPVPPYTARLTFGPPLSGSGGDPRGLWRFHTLVVHMDPDKADRFDLDRSTIDGMAWAELDHDTLLVAYEGEERIRLHDGNEMHNTNELVWQGAYEIQQDQLVLTEACRTGPKMFNEIRFSQHGDELTLMLTARHPELTFSLILDGQRWNPPAPR